MPQSIYEGFSYIGETIGSYTGDFVTGDYEGLVPVLDPLTTVPDAGQPEVVLSDVTNTVWILNPDAVTTPYYVDTGRVPADADIEWPKVPVINWVEGGWIQLNADIGVVDFSISHISWNRALLTIQDHKNFEYLDYEMVIDGPGVSNAPRSLADDTYSVWLDGLIPDSTYDVTLLVNLIESDGLNIQGKDTYANIQAIVGAAVEDVWIQSDQTPEGDIGDGWMWDGDSWENIGALQSKPNTQSFTTPANSLPKAVTDLSSPARSNKWIDLKWTTPGGSSAVKYKVYQGYYGGPTKYVKTVSGTSTRIANLREDRKYRYFVRGVNVNDLEGPWSNELRWATGHGEIRRQGRDNSIVFNPSEWGSYRQDIQWRWATYNRGILARNPHIYQGYWPGNNWRGAANPAQNIAAGNTRRYWGTITYNDDAIRRALDRKHGNNVGKNISITSLKIKKIYRHRTPGIYSGVGMNWHLTRANPFDSGQPPLYGSHWGPAMRAGTYIGMYGLPASWGTALVSGKSGSTNVNGLVLHRGDNQTNGYGAAGYGAWSGHNLQDPYYSGSWRRSDLRLVMKGNWNFVVRAYTGPWRW